MKRKPTTNPSRRHFLAGTAAFAGGGLVSSCSSTGAGSKPAPIPAFKARTQVGADEPIRMGVIGTGGMGRGHTGSILGLAEAGRENVQIAALADVCQTHLDAAHKVATEDGRQGGLEVTRYRDYKQLLARDGVGGEVAVLPGG